MSVNPIVKLLITFVFGLLLYPSENIYAQAPHVPDNPIDASALHQDPVEVIDRTDLPKKKKSDDARSSSREGMDRPSAAHSDKSAEVFAMPIVLPGQNMPICLSPPEMKVNLESEYSLDVKGNGIVTYVLEVKEGVKGPLRIPLYPSASTNDEPIGQL